MNTQINCYRNISCDLKIAGNSNMEILLRIKSNFGNFGASNDQYDRMLNLSMTQIIIMRC